MHVQIAMLDVQVSMLDNAQISMLDIVQIAMLDIVQMSMLNIVQISILMSKLQSCVRACSNESIRFFFIETTATKILVNMSQYRHLIATRHTTTG